MKINCLSCGHNVDLDDAYLENYEGTIKCYACGATLEIKTENSGLRRVHLCVPRKRFGHPAGADLSGVSPGAAEHNSARSAHADKVQ
jgi:DNA-directed RNA polymerase subunit RPC12/RpoP